MYAEIREMGTDSCSKTLIVEECRPCLSEGSSGVQPD